MRTVKCPSIIIVLMLGLITNVYGQKKKMYGYMDEFGNTVVEPKYDVGFDFHEGLAVIAQNGKAGFINKKGEVVIPMQYQTAGNFSQGIARVAKDNKFGFMNASGQMVIPFIYDYAMDMTKQGFAYVLKDKSTASWGVIDKNGKEVIPCNFQSLIFTPDRELMPAKQNGYWGFMDKNGKVSIPCRYDTVQSFYSVGVAEVTLNKKKGLINKNGKVTAPIIFDNFVFGGYQQRILLAEKGEEVYLINYEGEAVFIGQNAELSTDFYDGFVRVELNPKGGTSMLASNEGVYFISRSGKKTIPADWKNNAFTKARLFSDGVVAIQEDDDDDYGHWYYVDSFGGKINTSKYKIALPFENQIGWVSDKLEPPSYYAINRKGQVVIPGPYTDINSFYRGVIPVEKDGKWGVIDKNGRALTPFIYDNAGYFSSGLASVKQNDKYGYVNTSGSIVAYPKYAANGSGWDGYFPVAMKPGNGSKMLWGIMDSTGKEITPFKYDEIIVTVKTGNQVFVKVKLNGRVGLINVAGKEIVPSTFDYIDYLEEEKMIKTSCTNAASKKMEGYYSLDGYEVAPCRYVKLTGFKENVSYGITEDNRYWLINRSGRQVLLPKEYKAYNSSEGMILFYIEK